MNYYFQEPIKKTPNFISGSIDLITKFDLTKQYKKYCSTASLKLTPTFHEYVKDIPGTIDATADTALRDSIFGPQPPEMDKNSLTADDLHVNFTLDDAPIDPGLVDIEDVPDEEFEKSEQLDPSPRGSKFIIRLPTFGTKSLTTLSSKETSDIVAVAPADSKKRKSEKGEGKSKKKAFIP